MRTLGLAIGCGLVAFAQAAPPEILDLPVIEQALTIPMPGGGTEPLAAIKGFRMVAATPLLTAEINANIGSDSGALGAVERDRVRAYRGGGKADWRLPTEVELEVLSESAGPAHKEKSDCTKGKYQLMVSELIHVSCGIAWSSTTIEDDRAVAFGFISGTSRIAKLTEKKNSRALVVRSDAPAKKPSR